MNKKVFVVAMASIMALATFSSCGNGNSSKESDNDEEELVTTNLDEDDDFVLISNFITDSYNNDSYCEEDFLKAHCTPKLLKYLKEMFDYDDDGYACWLFRTGAQDCKPGTEDNPESKVLSVKKDEDGWYHYQFLDAGWKGENRLKVFVKDGTVWMDELETVYSEPEEELLH